MKKAQHRNRVLPDSMLKHAVSYPDNLLEDLLRARSLGCDLEALGYPNFLIRLYRRAIHSRRVMS